MSDNILYHKWQIKISVQETGERTKCLSPTGDHFFFFFYFGLQKLLLLGKFSPFLNTWQTNPDLFLTLNGPEHKHTHSLQNLSKGLHRVDHKNATSLKYNLQRIVFKIKKLSAMLYRIKKKYIIAYTNTCTRSKSHLARLQQSQPAMLRTNLHLKVTYNSLLHMLLRSLALQVKKKDLWGIYKPHRLFFQSLKAHNRIHWEGSNHNLLKGLLLNS